MRKEGSGKGTFAKTNRVDLRAIGLALALLWKSDEADREELIVYVTRLAVEKKDLFWNQYEQIEDLARSVLKRPVGISATRNFEKKLDRGRFLRDAFSHHGIDLNQVLAQGGYDPVQDTVGAAPAADASTIEAMAATMNQLVDGMNHLIEQNVNLTQLVQNLTLEVDSLRDTLNREKEAATDEPRTEPDSTGTDDRASEGITGTISPVACPETCVASIPSGSLQADDGATEDVRLPVLAQRGSALNRIRQMQDLSSPTQS